MTKVKLTSLSHGAGCACKLPAAQLQPLLAALPRSHDPNLLVGAATADDAGVYRVSDELALVQSVDFFTPIVDDPYDFGRIAAANALSDLYAMGARPLTALNLVAWSIDELGDDALWELLRGGTDIAEAAQVAILGGHTIDDREPKYGMAVTGIVDPGEMLTNGGGRPGDTLVLTKPLGAGAVTTALKKGFADAETVNAAVDVMTQLNRAAADAARAARAHAMTDVTGFGLLGHLHELATASCVAAVVEAACVPAIDGATRLLADDAALAGGSRENRRYAQRFASFAATVDEPRRRLLCDAMTSGGLLIAVSPGEVAGLPGEVIGQLIEGVPGTVSVT